MIMTKLLPYLLCAFLLVCIALTLYHYQKEKKVVVERETQIADLQEQLTALQKSMRTERIHRIRQAGHLQKSIWYLDRYGPSWAKKDLGLDLIRKELPLFYDIEGPEDILIQHLDQDLDGMVRSLIKELRFEDRPQERLFLYCCLLDLPAEMVADKYGWTTNNVRVKKCRLKDHISKLNNADYDLLFRTRK